MPNFYVYMVKTARDTLYTGISTDPSRREEEHNSSKRGARSLRGQRPVQLVWQSPELPKGEALSLEHKIKGLKRADKLRLIDGEIALPEEPTKVDSVASGRR